MTLPAERLVTEAGTIICGSLDDPRWSEAGRVHDWRNHVPEVVRDAWPHLDAMSRLVCYVMADKAASQEDWD